MTPQQIDFIKKMQSAASWSDQEKTQLWDIYLQVFQRYPRYSKDCCTATVINNIIEEKKDDFKKDELPQ
jgi:hypothetical protein